MCAQTKKSELITVGNIKGDRYKGKFFRVRKCVRKTYSIFRFDEANLFEDSYSYINTCVQTCTSWLDHVVSPNTTLVRNLAVIYDHSLHDNIQCTQ